MRANSLAGMLFAACLQCVSHQHVEWGVLVSRPNWHSLCSGVSCVHAHCLRHDVTISNDAVLNGKAIQLTFDELFLFPVWRIDRPCSAHHCFALSHLPWLTADKRSGRQEQSSSQASTPISLTLAPEWADSWLRETPVAPRSRLWAPHRAGSAPRSAASHLRSGNISAGPPPCLQVRRPHPVALMGHRV